MKKWDKMRELVNYIESQQYGIATFDDFVYAKDLKCISYAPQIGYNNWIFKYKGVPVCLFDAGNGFYGYTSWVSAFDVFVAKLLVMLEKNNVISIKEEL